jgi:predicted GTPase
MNETRILILGAGGRDFHNFNTVYRDREGVRVVAFTAAQIPHIENRVYPAALAGRLYPNGIPIRPEEEFEALVRDQRVHQVVFSYSDVSHDYVMHMASRSHAAGASFVMLGPRQTWLESRVPVVAVTAVRTGSGKSQTSRKVSRLLREMGNRVVVVRHPMPYGDLTRQRVQRFARYEDLAAADCTIEEREEYEPHLDGGSVVMAGVDYAEILAAAEREADVVLWDGGNNDFPFFKPGLWIVVADPLRAGHESSYHPGETNFRAADVIIINKVDSAEPAQVEAVRRAAAQLNPRATVIPARSPISLDDPKAVAGRRVLVIEDGPTTTHGEMGYGAGVVAARTHGAAAIVDPRPYAVGELAETYARYPRTGPLLPAMGYGERQLRDLEATIRATPCDLVLVATPIDLRRIITIDQPAQRVRYELDEQGSPDLKQVLGEFVARVGTRA